MKKEEMKVYQLKYMHERFGAIQAEGINLFSTLDKVYEYCELTWGLKKEDFDEITGYTGYAEREEEEGIYDYWFISEVVLDEDLEKLKAQK